MSDSLIPKFLDKINGIIKITQDSKKDRKDILKALVKLQDWVTGDRSLQQHKCCQSFLSYLWQGYGQDFQSRDGFISWMKHEVGFTDTKKVKELEINAKCPHCSGAIKEKAYFKEFIVKSLSFPDCSQKMHNYIFERFQKYAFDAWGVSFQDWYDHKFNIEPEIYDVEPTEGTLNNGN